MHLHGSRCCSTCLCKKSAHPQVITCLVLRCLPTHWSLPLFRVSLHVFQSLHLLYSAQPPCGRNRRVQEPLRTRRMRAWPCGVSKPSCTRECQFYKTDTGCKAGVKCLFPHHKVDEQPNKMPKKGYYSHKRRESDDKNAAATAENCTTIGPRLARLGSTGFSKRKTARFEEYDSLSLRYVKQVSGNRTDYRLEIQVKNPHQRSPYAMKFEDRSHEETERRQRCARSKAWNLAKNKYKLKEKDKATFYSPAEEWVLLAASIKEPEEREFVVDSTAIELWRLKDDLRNKIWALSTLVWRYVEEQDERRREATIKDFNFLLTRQDKKFFTF